jgi:two-component system, sensor histidine kinase YesM
MSTSESIQGPHEMKPFVYRLMKLLTALSINTKIIALIVCFLCLPFVIFSLLWFQKSTETIETNAREVNQELVGQTISQLDAYFNDLERSTFPLVAHPLIQKFMSLKREQTYELFDLRNEIEKSLLPNLFFGRTDIYGFSIVSRNGVYSNYGNADRARTAKLVELDELKDLEMYKVMGLTLNESTPVITVIRKFWDTERYQPTGFLVFDLNLNQITRILQNIKLGETGKISLVDAQGNIVYHTDSEYWGERISEDDRAQFQAKTEGYFFKGSGSHKIVTVFHRSPLNDWVMVSEVPLRELVGNLIWIRNLSIWVGSALIIFVLAILCGFAFYLSRSILLLQRLMNRAENGDLNVKAPERRNDEIGNLNRSFNKMVSEIRRLIEVVHTSQIKEKELQIKQREAVVMAMQSQINPHFLYNTLEVINSYALVEGVIPISNMTTALSDLFRYSVGNPQEIVTLKEEIAHLRSYFEIQKERYRSLKVDISAKDNITSKVQAVRLLVQPIVENAFIHGYERNKLRPDYIAIAGSHQDDAYVLTVSDHGGGMPVSKMEALNRLFANDEAGEDARVRIGLWNVHQRIRLVFGSEYGLHILKSDPTGTVIQIKLPFVDFG